MRKYKQEDMACWPMVVEEATLAMGAMFEDTDFISCNPGEGVKQNLLESKLRVQIVGWVLIILGGHFGPEKKYLAPPPPLDALPTSVCTTLPPPRKPSSPSPFFNKNTPPLFASDSSSFFLAPKKKKKLKISETSAKWWILIRLSLNIWWSLKLRRVCVRESRRDILHIFQMCFPLQSALPPDAKYVLK